MLWIADWQLSVPGSITSAIHATGERTIAFPASVDSGSVKLVDGVCRGCSDGKVQALGLWICMVQRIVELARL